MKLHDSRRLQYVTFHVDKTARKKINKETELENNYIPIGTNSHIQTILPNSNRIYISSYVNGMFSNIDHMLEQQNHRKKKSMKLRCFLEQINKIDKSLAKLRRKKTQKNKKSQGNITMYVIEIKRIIKGYYEQSYANKQVTQKKWINSQKYTSYQD